MHTGSWMLDTVHVSSAQATASSGSGADALLFFAALAVMTLAVGGALSLGRRV